MIRARTCVSEHAAERLTGASLKYPWPVYISPGTDSRVVLSALFEQMIHEFEKWSVSSSKKRDGPYCKVAHKLQKHL